MSACIYRAPVIGRALRVTAFLTVAFSVAMPAAQAAELQVPVSVALRGAVAEMAAVFEKRSGHTIKMTVAAPGEIVAVLQAGRHADVVVVTNGALTELENEGLVRRGRVSLATTGFGLATRSGDLAPDISTPEALRAALLGASKVIYNDPKVTPSGQLLLHIAERLGVAEQVKAKSLVVAAGTNVTTLAKDTSSGTVVALSVMVEITGHPGAKLVGPLPKEFTGHLSGLRNMVSVEITKVSHRKDPIYEYTSIGMPWTEIDYMFLNTCPPLYVQLKEKFPEIEAVNALYTHGLVVIVSTKMRVGGFGKAVGMAVLTTPHGLGYAKIVIVVDDFVDPFNLPQVMWAISTKVNPKYDTVVIPELSVLALDPGSEPPGMTDKMIIDATTPAPPEKHGEYTMQVMDPPEAKDWLPKLQALLKKA